MTPDTPRTHQSAAGPHVPRRDGGGYLPIADYGIIGDCRSAALVGIDGSIDWCCLPRFDSPSLFGRLLDAEKGGAWELAPIEPHSCRQAYADKTNILRTVFQTSDGLAEITDFMPIDEHDAKQHARPHKHPRIVRVVTGLAGEVRFRQHIDMRPDYGREPNPLKSEEGRLHGDAGDRHYCVSASIPLHGHNQQFTVGPGDTVTIGLSISTTGNCGTSLADVEIGRQLLRTSQVFWWRWISQCTYRGPYEEHVWRSALALKLLTYAPTGAIVAAPTTSLPEWVGGSRNWDYRFTWLRDASFTLYAQLQLGFHQEATDFMEWLGHLTISKGLKNLYSLDGHVPRDEEELDHLSGYRNSRPVRVNNGAADQLQLDVFGELLDSVYLFALNGGKISNALWSELVTIVNFAVQRWQEPDASLWEVRGETLNFVYSKAMCWAAVDRGIRLGTMLKKEVDPEWLSARTRIHRAVMAKGYSKEIESFTQSFGSDQLDAGALRLVQLGFLRTGDPRMRSTIDAVDDALSTGPLVYRYRTQDTNDGLSSPEGSFIICAFWLADALALVGELEKAERRFERLLAFASPLGLFSEEVDARTGAFLGNFPQAFSHLALISAAVNIERRRNNTLSRNPRH
ncbi:MAG: glycoside hydrolase family 15 protein [Candidatus Dormibacteria bacterium]